MPKPAVARRGVRKHGGPPPAESPNIVEGRISDICCDLAMEAKRMRQLQEQADELRRAIRQWADPDAPSRRRGLSWRTTSEQ
jgi:hypothetical protein